MTKRKLLPEPAEDNLRVRSRRETAAALNAAIKALTETEGAKINIARVADYVGCSTALIHNKHPDIAERIRELTGKSSRDQRDEKHRLLVAAQQSNRALVDENRALLEEVRVLASKNESLRRQLAEASAVADSKNVIPLPHRNR